jgi:hypothetical protein
MADDLTFTEQEREFLTCFVKILEHLKNRAIKAEREVKNLRQEMTALREKVEYLTEIGTPTLAKTLGDLERANQTNSG